VTIRRCWYRVTPRLAWPAARGVSTSCDGCSNDAGICCYSRYLLNRSRRGPVTRTGRRPARRDKPRGAVRTQAGAQAVADCSGVIGRQHDWTRTHCSIVWCPLGLGVGSLYLRPRLGAANAFDRSDGSEIREADGHRDEVCIFKKTLKACLPVLPEALAIADKCVGRLGAPLVGGQHTALPLRGLAVGRIGAGAGNSDLYWTERAHQRSRAVAMPMPA
jgi:hypothetical protein